MSSGAYRIPAMSSAWSVKASGGKRGGASGCVLAARSVAVRSSKVSVSVTNDEKRSVSFSAAQETTKRDTYEEVQLLETLRRTA